MQQVPHYHDYNAVCPIKVGLDRALNTISNLFWHTFFLYCFKILFLCLFTPDVEGKYITPRNLKGRIYLLLIVNVLFTSNYFFYVYC